MLFGVICVHLEPIFCHSHEVVSDDFKPTLSCLLRDTAQRCAFIRLQSPLSKLATFNDIARFTRLYLRTYRLVSTYLIGLRWR